MRAPSKQYTPTKRQLVYELTLAHQVRRAIEIAATALMNDESLQWRNCESGQFTYSSMYDITIYRKRFDINGTGGLTVDGTWYFDRCHFYKEERKDGKA